MKYSELVKLYEDTIKYFNYEHDKKACDHFMDFLKVSSRNYKLTFEQQLLLYAQKPDATAVLEMPRWNKLFGRKVVAGTRGIAFFGDEDRSTQRIIYHFDITDTEAYNIGSKPVPIWKMKKAYNADVIEMLEDTYGELAEKGTLIQAVKSAVSNLIDDNIDEYFEQLCRVADVESLRKAKEADINNSDERLKRTYAAALKTSVSYSVLARLDVDLDKAFTNDEKYDMLFVNEITSKKSFLSFGKPINTLTKIVLSEISRTIIALDKESNSLDYYNDKKNERSNDNDERRDRIQEGRGLSAAELNVAGATGSGNQYVGTASQRISEGAQTDRLQRVTNGVQADRALSGSTDESSGNVRQADERNETVDGIDRGTQTTGYDGMGRTDEQSQTKSDGDSAERSNIRRLKREYHDRETEDESLPFLNAKDNEINEMLFTTPFLAASIDEIKAFYNGTEDKEECTEYIKGIFNDDETEMQLSTGKIIGYKTYQNVLHIWTGNKENKESEAFYDWRVISTHFKALQLLGNIIKPINTVAEQEQILSAGRKFSFPQPFIDYILKTKHYEDTRYYTYEQMMKNKPVKDNAAFLRKQYGIGGMYPIISGTNINFSTDSKGILLEVGFRNKDKRQLISWEQAAKRIDELVKSNNYLTEKELVEYPQWLEKEEQRRLEIRIECEQREREAEERRKKAAEEAAIPKKLVYEVGDNISINGNKYIIYSIQDNGRVSVQSEKHPLFIEEFSKEDFEKKLNTYIYLNEHLLKPIAEEQKTENDARQKIIDGYANIKKQYPDFTVLYEVGDFYEVIGKNAAKAAEVLDIRLGSVTDGNGKKYPMCGFTKSSIDTHGIIEKLLSNGIDVILSYVDDAEKGTRRIKQYISAEKYKEYIKHVNSEIVFKDGRTYKIESINRFGDVSMLDVSMLYPISRIEKIFDVIPFLNAEEQVNTEETENKEIATDETIAEEKPSASEYVAETVAVYSAEENHLPYDVVFQTLKAKEPELNKEEIKQDTEKEHKESKSVTRINYKITDNDIGVGTPLERFYNNKNAIQLLKKLESEHRLARSYEQDILSEYVGWGGLSEFFNKDNIHYNEIEAVMTAEEIEKAKESTLTAFYTPPIVIKSIYDVLKRLNFKGGNVLEPSCGIGNFMGLMPEEFKANVYGIELDSISAKIARQLYQKNRIQETGFETSELPDSFFDIAIGNVPFGNYKLNDAKYNKYNFFIHDYFFAKTLDKLRPSGVMAFITSKGTMDKDNSSVRRYIAERAELLGAIRLPNNTFKAAAGTEVTSDILFLQKREKIVDAENAEWLHTDNDENGIKINRYFVEHPEMILGKMEMVSSRFGQDAACLPIEDMDLSELLNNAVLNINGNIEEHNEEYDEEENRNEVIPATPDVKNFSFANVDGKMYYRNNSEMRLVSATETGLNRIKGLIEIRDSVYRLLDLQKNNASDEEITGEQQHLNRLYDSYTAKYGIINNRGNTIAFSEDSSFPLLTALEIVDENGELKAKADIFTKRTIKPYVPVESVDTAMEALTVSISEKAEINMEYMTKLSGKSEEQLYDELKGVIFYNPLYDENNNHLKKYLPADEYLSGKVRDKLRIAKSYEEQNPEKYGINVEALEKVQPTDLTASEIAVRLGATWLPVDVVQQFIYDLLNVSYYRQSRIKVSYEKHTSQWYISEKNLDDYSIEATQMYGTARINAYNIIEQTLNLKQVKISDKVTDPDGTERYVVNVKQTQIAQSKQEIIKEKFVEWLWKEPERRERLCKLYNETFNNLRPREYDGTHLEFAGMNPEISLMPHQKNAVAHILYGGNTLLAHCVGAGKTFEMVTAAMESKRLGLCTKSMFVVPNHLTRQWAADFLRLYPAANILVATKKDFETKNRKKFCGRIATGDYDAIIIGHSQFEKIPLSPEKLASVLHREVDEISAGIKELRERENGRSWSIKQLAAQKKRLEERIKELTEQKNKDDTVNFEQLGVDRIFIDEAHYYKNLYFFTKMNNVAGIAQSDAKKSADLFAKCQYLDELTDSKGIVFATGTPISNTMAEMYTMQRYLQYNTLRETGLQTFDNWASTFAETKTAMELSPTGKGYRTKTRFATFYNLPELMDMFKEFADIKTADTLKLPVPKAEYHNIAVKPTEIQKDMVSELAERAEKIRKKEVSSNEDNMLLITNDGRKLALDQRLVSPLLPDEDNTKVNTCVQNIFDVWEKTSEMKCAQLVFCDLSTPKANGQFNVYDDIRNKLISKGVPENEIEFIHNANTEVQKQELFTKVRNGIVRVLIGSTMRMGAGTNVQDLLIAIHDLDCPYRPADLEQRAGRLIRQGNKNETVHVYRYVTEQTFDAYLWQIIENKQKFISQIMTSKSPVRSAEDVDEAVLSAAEVKVLATGNPLIKEKMSLEVEVQKLKLLKSNYLSEKYALEDKLMKTLPKERKLKEQTLASMLEDAKTVNANPQKIKGDDDKEDNWCGINICGIQYDKKEEAGEAIIEQCKHGKALFVPEPIGTYRGFTVLLSFDAFKNVFKLELKGCCSHYTDASTSAIGNIQKMDNALSIIDKACDIIRKDIEKLNEQEQTAREQLTKPFMQEAELQEKIARLAEVDAALNLDKKDENEIETEEGEEQKLDTDEKENETEEKAPEL